MTFALRPLQLTDETALAAAQRTMAPWTFAFDWEPGQDFAEYVALSAAWPERADPGRAPTT